MPASARGAGPAQDKIAGVKKALSAAERRDLTQIFCLVDRSDSGFLDWEELHHTLRGLGFPVSRTEVQRLVRQVNRTEGMVNVVQFLAIVEGLGSIEQEIARTVRHGFQLFTDTDNIDAAELRRSAKLVGMELSLDDANAMVALADMDGDGTVGRGDFVHVMRQTPLFNPSDKEEDESK